MSENKPRGNVDPLEDTRAESIRPGKLIAGAPIGGYHLEYVLGEGGMGIVWSARDPLLDRTIAIKVLKSKDAAVAMRTRLLREAQAMARLKHPNVLTVHEVGTEGDRDFIVMELVDGGPLDHWLAFGPPMEEVLAALFAAGRGLAAAHAAGLVHRDFKPNNVLRSKDGRVLVTDFGLARGLGEHWQHTSVTASGAGFEAGGGNDSLDPSITPATPSKTPSMPGRRDNVLDSPLTRTGAMIGTPAYMAPEQFAGSEPDPRTDQFAFCITAWQALTGARPFYGRTIEELRVAAGGGVASVVAELSKPIRAVLTRGLDPDPAKRWPDLQTLLRELEIAARPRKKRWPLIAGAVAAVAAIAVIAVIATRGGAEPTCEPSEIAWGDAWSADKHELAEAVQWIGPVLEDHRRRWTSLYDQTCKGGARAEGRLGCLRAVRDRIALVADLLRDPATHTTIDPHVLITPPDACAGKPYAIPALPTDRGRVASVLAKAIIEPVRDGLDVEAKAAGWPPLVPMVAVAAGRERMKRGDIARARLELDRARAAAESTDPRVAVIARLHLLAASTIELSHPEDYPGSKRDVMHEDIAHHLTYARSALKTINDEPLLAGILAFIEAEALADLAERAPRKTSFNEALARANDARKLFDTANDVRRSARTAALFADIQLRRGDASALADAEFVARSAAEALERAKLPPIPALDDVLGKIAFARNDLGNAHRWLDRGAPPLAPATGERVQGVVLDPEGKPVMNAIVVVWTGDLHGDPLRAYTDRRTVRGEIVETAAEGKFEVHRRDGAAIVAESGALRSLPQQLVAGKLVLQLAATTELVGKVEARESTGVDAYARYSAGPHAWFVHAPIDKDQAFRISGLPRATVQAGLSGRNGTGTRRISGAVVNLATDTSITKRLVWSGGLVLDVIARGKVGPDATAWIGMRFPLDKIATRRDLEAFLSSASETASSSLSPIGSRITDAGRQKYMPGDRHALFVGDFFERWACIAPSGSPTAKVTCKQLDDNAAVVIEIP